MGGTAIESKNLEKIEFVLSCEINVTYKNQLGLGALYDFCEIFRTNRSEKMLYCLSLLLKKGCKDFSHDRFGQSAIKFLAEKGHLDGVKILVAFGDSIEALKWSENHKSAVFSDLNVLISNLHIFSDATADLYNRTPLVLFMHFRNVKEIRELFTDLNRDAINLKDIKNGLELMVQADKCDELQEILKFYPAGKEESYWLLMLSRKFKSSVCLDFFLDLNSSLTNEKTVSEKELIEEIKKVFKGVILNGGMGLKCAESYDSYEYDKIEDMLEEKKNWQNISFEELNMGRAGMGYFDSKGLLFHLPAYMICDLIGKLDSDLTEDFTWKKYNELTKKFLNFNYAQMKVLINYFEFCKGKRDFEKHQLKIDRLADDNDEIAVLISDLNKILNTKLSLSQKNFNGKWAVYYENGVKQYEAEYKDGKQNGKEISWYSNGSVESEHEYKNGITNGKSKSWYSNGALQSEGEYKDGEQINKFTSWYLNGSKRCENKFSDNYGNPNGKETSWYENGNKEAEIDYLGEIPNGKYLKWDENGKILIDQEYKDGVMIRDNLAHSRPDPKI